MTPFSNVASIARWVLALAIIWITPMNANSMDEQLKRFTLSNGMAVIVKEDHARKVSAIQLWVKVGSADEQQSDLGISHLIEHMAFKGTERRGPGKIAGEVEALGGDINAYTSWDETVFHVTVPSSATLQGLDIVTDAVLRPVLDQKELEKEKKVVLEEILEGEERPQRIASKLLFKTAYAASPYRFPVIGYKDVVSGFTREDVLQFRKKWYLPENMFFVIVGDVDAEQVRSELERLTRDIKPTGFFRPPRPVEPKQDKLRTALVRSSNTRETRLQLAFHIPSMAGYDVNALDLAADILGSRQSSRLIKVIKKDKGLVNNINAYAITPKKPGLFLISATLEAKNLEAATAAIVEELGKLGKQAPSTEELERAKINIESHTLYSRETVQGVARIIGGFEADLGDPSYEHKYLKLNRVVTAEDVSRVVREYLSSPNISLTVLLPEKDAPGFSTEKLAAIIKGPGPSESSKAQIASEGETLTRTLSNGMRIVLRRDTSNPLLSFRLACLGGKRFENTDDEGIMNFVARMLNKGAGKMTEVEISRKIEDMGGRLGGSSGYDSSGLAMSFFSRHLDDGLGLLAKLYSDPTFPKDKIERERELIINRIRTGPDRPIPFAIKNFNKVMFPEHPYGFDKDGTIATVAGFTRDDLVQAYKRFAVPSNTVITGVGDMDLNKAMGIITDLFGKVPGKALDAPDIPKETRLKEKIEEIVRITRAKSHIVIGFQGVTLSDPDRYPLEVLSNILAGQGGRLFMQLRDKESLAYTVTSFVRPGMDPGIFAFYMACEVSKTQRAVKGLFEQIDLVRNTPVGREELDRAKNNLVGHHKIALQSSWARSENTALNTLYGLGYDYDAEFLKKVSAVTSDDVIRVAKKYLDPDRSVTVKILPEEDKKE